METQMQIRLAAPNDVQKIAKLNNEVQSIHSQAWPGIFRWPTKQHDVEKIIGEIVTAPQNRIFIAEDKQGTKGYIFCEIIRRAEDAFHKPRELIYIHHIAVNSVSRGKGIGARLIKSAFDLAEDESIDLVMLDVWSFNSIAKEFFSKQGFAVYNERMMVNRAHLRDND
jgi:ribosomal protein S18 acetylase RimI-like enzyme